MMRIRNKRKRMIRNASCSLKRSPEALYLGETSLELLLELGQVRVLEVLFREAVRLEGAVPPHVLGYVVGLIPGVVVGDVLEYVDRPDQCALGELETECHHAGRAIQPRRYRLRHAAWHQ